MLKRIHTFGQFLHSKVLKWKKRDERKSEKYYWPQKSENVGEKWLSSRIQLKELLVVMHKMRFMCIFNFYGSQFSPVMCTGYTVHCKPIPAQSQQHKWITIKPIIIIGYNIIIARNLHNTFGPIVMEPQLYRTGDMLRFLNRRWIKCQPWHTHT